MTEFAGWICGLSVMVVWLILWDIASTLGEISDELNEIGKTLNEHALDDEP